MIHSESSLLKVIKDNYLGYDAIVVEGADGVGKGRILNVIADFLNVVPYRPDYNLWQNFDHRPYDRWKPSAFFWDIYSHFGIHSDKTMLFDRGVMSGAVYNDERLAFYYKDMLRDMKVLHILVTCSEEDYLKFSESRGIEDPLGYNKCSSLTDKYKELLELSGVEYLIYHNHYDEALFERLSRVCEGCGHYSYGYCRNPEINSKVEPNYPRCEKSVEKEAQDRDVSEMQPV